ncbi:MAG: DUF262 domain-containing protein [Snodgrassella sp.]|nr:DUF262 domain-containing protein [Snodgrassella sp.]
MPLPSIFVSQRDDGVWDVVDGLQRIATILAFMGKLKDDKYPENNFLSTDKTRYLPSLKGKTWQSLAPELQRIFKREKIDIKIIKRESEPNAKFELFQRLNTGGSGLTAQEIRNCLLIMVNKKAFNYIKELSRNPDFLATMPISDKQSEEALYEEYVVRYFIQLHPDISLRRSHANIGPYFDEEVVRLFDTEFQYEVEQKLFEQTFQIINQSLGEDAFKKFHSKEEKYKGAVSTPMFEVLTIIIANKIRLGETVTPDNVMDFSKKASNEVNAIPSTTRPISKMDETLNIAKKLLNNGQN